MFYIEVLTCLSDDFSIVQTMEQNSVSDTPYLGVHVIMEHSPSVTNYYRLISMRKFHPSNARRRMPRMNNDHVSHYSEETNVETNAEIVVHLYRIVPHMHSTVLSAVYMCIKSAIEIFVESDMTTCPHQHIHILTYFYKRKLNARSMSISYSYMYRFSNSTACILVKTLCYIPPLAFKINLIGVLFPKVQIEEIFY